MLVVYIVVVHALCVLVSVCCWVIRQFWANIYRKAHLGSLLAVVGYVISERSVSIKTKLACIEQTKEQGTVKWVQIILES